MPYPKRDTIKSPISFGFDGNLEAVGKIFLLWLWNWITKIGNHISAGLLNEVSLAFVGLSSFYIMWNYNYTPIHIFASTTWWQPLGWIISFPTGIPGAVGIPFFTLSLRTVINNCRSGIALPQLPNPFEKPREFIHESPQ